MRDSIINLISSMSRVSVAGERSSGTTVITATTGSRSYDQWDQTLYNLLSYDFQPQSFTTIIHYNDTTLLQSISIFHKPVIVIQNLSKSRISRARPFFDLLLL